MKRGYQARRRAKLTDHEICLLNQDFVERDRLRRQIAENMLDVLELELDVSRSTIVRMEKNDFDANRLAIIPREVCSEVKRRRQIYWTVRESYDFRYSDRALQARYNISKSTLLRRAREFRKEQRQAIWRDVNQEVRRAA